MKYLLAMIWNIIIFISIFLIGYTILHIAGIRDFTSRTLLDSFVSGIVIGATSHMIFSAAVIERIANGVLKGFNIRNKKSKSI